MKFLRPIKDSINYAWFLLRGKKPWIRGYEVYKRREIMRVLASGKFEANELEDNYGLRLDERVLEYPWLFSRLPKNPGKLLDAGSALNHEFLLSHHHLKNKQTFISTLAPEQVCFWKQKISYVYEDLRETCYRDNYFDWIASISTIEHIGLDNNFLYTQDILKKENQKDAYLIAIKEYNRILKPGGTLYLTFPFGRTKNHGWFQVFDSPMLDKVIETFAPTSITEFHFRYDADGWKPSSREASKNATYFDIHQQKTYEPDYAAASRAIVCLEMVK
ncbi:class I SAM-dependent methyltransferase [Laspinema sp. A4]|uniref:class I SAM-dependent methyltransferase n=1 Tax=Laspinema sp. D2d TaxID=2953686 RepID=UPI0021BA9D0D|nr:class I SAM-dependent methyltransferase [Laspinema sp. D2d]MCT7983613.1 class I SAM-dependent methyltransferase [Laspinema sp. D2d]